MVSSIRVIIRAFDRNLEVDARRSSAPLVRGTDSEGALVALALVIDLNVWSRRFPRLRLSCYPIARRGHTIRILLAATRAVMMSLPVAARDFQKGLERAQRGDYAKALRDRWPLAEQDHGGVQDKIGIMYENPYRLRFPAIGRRA